MRALRAVLVLLLAAAPAGAQTIDFGAKVQWDNAHLHRARVGVAGTLLPALEFQLEGDLDEPRAPWRDVYLNLAARKRLEIRGGHFKVPFSLGRLTSVMQQDFANRALAATYLAPGRDSGVMAHGTIRKGLKYQGGVFRSATAGRLTVAPWRELTVGASFTAGTVAEGLNSLPADGPAGDPVFPRVFVNGRRRRVGAEVDWHRDRASATAEVIRSVDERRGQGTDERDLPSLVADGWYAAGTWRVTGAKKSASAIELAARVEGLRMWSRADGELPSTSARAPALASRGLTVFTVGANWYPRRWMKVQANAIRDRGWLPVVRLQVGV